MSPRTEPKVLDLDPTLPLAGGFAQRPEDYPMTCARHRPNGVNTHSPPRTANQQLNPLSKRQQRKQRALQNKQKQQQEREQQQSHNEQRDKENRNQRKQKNNNQGQNHPKSPIVQSPKAQGGKGEQYDSWGNTKGQNDRISNHGARGWGNEEATRNNQDNTGKNDNKNDQGEQRNSGSGSPRRDARENHNSPREMGSRWDNSRPASPDRASGNDVDFLRGGWGQSDDGAKRNSHSRSNHSNEDHNRNDGWGDDDTKSYHKKSKRDRHASPERKSRGRSSPNRDWGHNDHEELGNSRNRSRSNSWGHAEERRGGSPTWSQDRNVHRDKKKKERWEIELEANMKRGRSRSRSPQRSDAGWDNRRQGDWKETQKW
ncbi:hypothetical protein VN97_g10036 [Penicillium thymicola]|uniref:Uncharacterized protein n=1 Tax=Penicillium thymicola TaxID=293382 RepID=A0AAI9X461_PENTH|nr:hypothetical protein VN97_g10036 [Penicillium thymicola]